MPTYVHEKNIVKAILVYLNGLPNCRARKRHGSIYSVGEPDITGCIKGQRFEFEVKAPGNTATPLQLEEIALWQRAGAIAEVVYSVDDVKSAMKGLV